MPSTIFPKQNHKNPVTFSSCSYLLTQRIPLQLGWQIQDGSVSRHPAFRLARRWPRWVGRVEAKDWRFFSVALALNTLALELEDCCFEDDVLPIFEGWSLVSFENSGQIGNVHLRKLPLLNHIHFYGVFSWVMDLQCDAWVIWLHGVWPLSCDSWTSYCKTSSKSLEQNIQQVAGVTWSFVSIGLCWSITTIAMPHGVSII